MWEEVEFVSRGLNWMWEEVDVRMMLCGDGKVWDDGRVNLWKRFDGG